MAIDPMLYKKYNGRNVDVGATLAKAAARKSEVDTAPKGVTGGLNVNRGMSQLGEGFFLLRWLATFGKLMRRDKD